MVVCLSSGDSLLLFPRVLLLLFLVFAPFSRALAPFNKIGRRCRVPPPSGSCPWPSVPNSHAAPWYPYQFRATYTKEHPSTKTPSPSSVLRSRPSGVRLQFLESSQPTNSHPHRPPIQSLYPWSYHFIYLSQSELGTLFPALTLSKIISYHFILTFPDFLD